MSQHNPSSSIKSSAEGHFDGVKVFSATMAKTRELLSERITSWIKAHPEFKIVDTVVTQSSDAAFHCLSYTIFYRIV